MLYFVIFLSNKGILQGFMYNKNYAWTPTPQWDINLYFLFSRKEHHGGSLEITVGGG